MDNFYRMIFLITIATTLLRLNIPISSHYSTESKEMNGTITKIIEKENYTIYEIKEKEKIIGYQKDKNLYELGDKIKVKGLFEKPSKNTTDDLFNYQEYLKRKGIFFVVSIESTTLLQKNKNIYYDIKQKIIKSFHKNPYLHILLLGDKSYMKEEVIRSFQENGISHLFAISGMHITLLSSIIEKIIRKKFSEEKTYKITIIIILSYLLLVGLSPSMLRGVLFYILFKGNSIYYFYIKKENLFIVTLSISLLISPYNIFDIGFQYSYLISYSLLKRSEVLKTNNKILSMLKVSLTSFIVSIPITIKNYNQLNFLSVIYNLFYVPYVSTFFFPMTLSVAIFKPLEPIYNVMIKILEESSLCLSNVNIAKLLWMKVPKIIYILYFAILFIWLNTNQKRWIIILISILSIHFLIPYISPKEYIKMIDIGQGDSILLVTNHKKVLIDTGGKMNDRNNRNSKIFFNILQPTLRKEGIKKLDYLIISHGDYDHMGEAINLVNNIKTDKIILNCGRYNDSERKLMDILNKKSIKYYSCIDELNLDRTSLYFLKTKDFNNENDNSNVIYTEINNFKILFMGDASIRTEQEILKEYNLEEIDILKVGHHGSRTSSGKEFMEEINPKYALISVGKDNKFKHPNKEALDNLKSAKIYRTDRDGTITITFKKNKLKIETDSQEE